MAISNTTLRDIDVIRGILRSFYIYGFRSGVEYYSSDSEGSIGFSGSRNTFINQKNKVESWLGDYLRSYKKGHSEVLYLAVNSAEGIQNPFFDIYKRSAFGDKEILKDFLIFDVLLDGDRTLNSLLEAIYERGAEADCHDEYLFESATISYRLDDMEKLGCVETYQSDGLKWYRLRRLDIDLECWLEVLQFSSETVPLGVVGALLMERLDNADESALRFKQHFLFHALDEVVLLDLMQAAHDKRWCSIEYYDASGCRYIINSVLPLYLYISTQSGRHSMLVYDSLLKEYTFLRIDRIANVNLGVDLNGSEYSLIKRNADSLRKYVWGTSIPRGAVPKSFSMDLMIGSSEGYLLRRLYREKRNGRVEKISKTSYRYETEVLDLNELKPWIRSWYGRILCLSSSEESFVEEVKQDVYKVLKGYGIVL